MHLGVGSSHVCGYEPESDLYWAIPFGNERRRRLFGASRISWVVDWMHHAAGFCGCSRRSSDSCLQQAAGLRDETYGTTNRDVFLPEVVGTLERRALQKIDILAQLVADPAAELVYSCEPRGNRGPLLLRYMGSPAILPLFGFVASDVEKRSPAVFQPTNAAARYKVASRSAKRVSVDAADAAKALDRQKVAKPNEQQTPLNTGITAREESATPEAETLLAVEATPDGDGGADLDGAELSGADLVAEEVGKLAAKGASKGKKSESGEELDASAKGKGK